MIYLHYLYYVSQELANEAMKRLDGLSYIKSMQVLDMPSSWALQVQTEGSLNANICQFLSQELKPMTPIWNRPELPPIFMTNFGTRENWHSSKSLDPGNDEHVHQGHHYGSRSRP